MPVDAREFAAALGQYAAGVCLLAVKDGIDDVGTTVTSVMSVSATPPLVAVGLGIGLLGVPWLLYTVASRCCRRTRVSVLALALLDVAGRGRRLRLRGVRERIRRPARRQVDRGREKAH